MRETPELGVDALLEDESSDGGEGGTGLGELGVYWVLGRQRIVAANLGLLAEGAEEGHRRHHRVLVQRPQVHEAHRLQLQQEACMRSFSHKGATNMTNVSCSILHSLVCLLDDALC